MIQFIYETPTIAALLSRSMALVSHVSRSCRKPLEAVHHFHHAHSRCYDKNRKPIACALGNTPQ